MKIIAYFVNQIKKKNTSAKNFLIKKNEEAKKFNYRSEKILFCYGFLKLFKMAL